MKMVELLRRGWKLVWSNKRLVLFVWLLNAVTALILALPLYVQLDKAIRTTVYEEKLLQQPDQTWWNTFAADTDKSEIAKLFDMSILGTAPFYHHLDGMLNGSVVRTVSSLVYDLVVKFQFKASSLDLLTILALLYAVISIFTSGGLIGVFVDGRHATISEFAKYGAAYFGRFLRLALLSFIVYVLFFHQAIQYLHSAIPVWTENSLTERTPFIYYMLMNAGGLLFIGLVGMLFDYAKIRTVIEDRYSALIAVAAASIFAYQRFAKAAGLYALLALIGLLLMGIYGLLLMFLPVTSWWAILLMIVLQQVYVLSRIGLKSVFYAGQTVLFQSDASPVPVEPESPAEEKVL